MTCVQKINYYSDRCVSPIYALHRGIVVIPKSASPARIKENLKSTAIMLDTEDMKRLRELDRSLRYITVHDFHLIVL